MSSLPNFLDWKSQNTVFAWAPKRPLLMTVRFTQKSGVVEFTIPRVVDY